MPSCRDTARCPRTRRYRRRRGAGVSERVSRNRGRRARRRRAPGLDRKSTRLNSSHSQISYAVFFLKKKDALVQLPADQPLFIGLEALYSTALATLDLIPFVAWRTEPARMLANGTYRPVALLIQGHT